MQGCGAVKCFPSTYILSAIKKEKKELASIILCIKVEKDVNENNIATVKYVQAYIKENCEAFLSRHKPPHSLISRPAHCLIYGLSRVQFMERLVYRISKLELVVLHD